MWGLMGMEGLRNDAPQLTECYVFHQWTMYVVRLYGIPPGSQSTILTIYIFSRVLSKVIAGHFSMK